MKEYFYPTLFFKKKWVWFSGPHDVSDADMVTFFSYNKVDAEGFRRKKGITSIIDLTKDIDAIWLDMRKSFIRKQIKRGEKNEIIVKQDDNFKDFKKIYKNFRKARGLSRENYKVFKENALLFSAYYKNKIIAGGVFVTSKPCIRAWALSSLRLDQQSGRMRDIVGQANRMVIWEAIKYAKNNGYEMFDLGGIKLDSPNKEDINLAEFKEAFGGARKECYFYIKVYSKLLKIWLRLRKIKVR